MDYVIGWMTTRQGVRDEFLRQSQPFVEATRREEGVLFFDLLPSTEDADVVVTIEGYANEKAHQAHLNSEHFAAFWSVFQSLVLDGRFENVFSNSVRTDIVRASQPDR